MNRYEQEEREENDRRDCVIPSNQEGGESVAETADWIIPNDEGERGDDDDDDDDDDAR